jgi:hypothetical protein
VVKFVLDAQDKGPISFAITCALPLEKAQAILDGALDMDVGTVEKARDIMGPAFDNLKASKGVYDFYMEYGRRPDADELATNMMRVFPFRWLTDDKLVTNDEQQVQPRHRRNDLDY